MKEDYEKEFIKKINSINIRKKYMQKLILDIHRYIYGEESIGQSAMALRSRKGISVIEMIMKPKKGNNNKEIKIKEGTTEYEKIKSIYDNKRKSLRYHWNYGEVLILRSIKKKYGLPPKLSVKELLSYLRKCENN